jgi:large subunit ribosomal protein L17
MKKKVFGRKLSRERSSREMLFVSLVENLVLNNKIITTKAKAKAIQGMIDGLVVLAKKQTLASKRNVLSKLKGKKEVSTILWRDVAKTFSERVSGFTRIISLPQRKGDMAEMVRLEWVEEIKKTEKPKKEKVISEKKIKEIKKEVKTKPKMKK